MKGEGELAAVAGTVVYYNHTYHWTRGALGTLSSFQTSCTLGKAGGNQENESVRIECKFKDSMTTGNRRVWGSAFRHKHILLHRPSAMHTLTHFPFIRHESLVKKKQMFLLSRFIQH